MVLDNGDIYNHNIPLSLLGALEEEKIPAHKCLGEGSKRAEGLGVQEGQGGSKRAEKYRRAWESSASPGEIPGFLSCPQVPHSSS